MTIYHFAENIIIMMVTCTFSKLYIATCFKLAEYILYKEREMPNLPKLYKYKKQLKKIEGVSRDGRIKKYTNKSCRDDNKQNAPYILFSSNMPHATPLFFVSSHTSPLELVTPLQHRVVVPCLPVLLMCIKKTVFVTTKYVFLVYQQYARVTH